MNLICLSNVLRNISIPLELIFIDFTSRMSTSTLLNLLCRKRGSKIAYWRDQCPPQLILLLLTRGVLCQPPQRMFFGCFVIYQQASSLFRGSIQIIDDFVLTFDSHPLQGGDMGWTEFIWHLSCWPGTQLFCRGTLSLLNSHGTKNKVKLRCWRFHWEYRIRFFWWLEGGWRVLPSTL